MYAMMAVAAQHLLALYISRDVTNCVAHSWGDFDEEMEALRENRQMTSLLRLKCERGNARIYARLDATCEKVKSSLSLLTNTPLHKSSRAHYEDPHRTLCLAGHQLTHRPIIDATTPHLS